MILTAALGAAGVSLFALGYYLERYHLTLMDQHHDRIAAAYENGEPELAREEFERFENNQWFDYAQIAFLPCYIAGVGLLMLAAMRLWGVP